MAGGMSLSSDGGRPTPLEGKFTFYVAICAIIAATGGLMFGYDIGISGGVTAMDGFLEKFFHTVYVRKHLVHEDNYCKYDNQGLQLFTSSLYLSALIASFSASKSCTKYGRKPTMQAASAFFLVGTVLCAAAVNLFMLIIGRIFLGVGVGFANQAVPLFLSELAPAKIRGALNILFQLDVTIGIFIANIVNYFTSEIHPWGWRLSLGLAGVPASILCLGSFIIPETPTSLVEHGKLDEGIKMLRKVRGVENVEAEFEELKQASKVAEQVRHPYRMLMKRPSQPPLVIGILMQVFQQFTGINAIMFYAPVLFQTVGFKNNASLLSSVITGIVNVLSTLISVFSVDKAGRRVLLLSACFFMFIAQTTIGSILHVYLKTTNSLHKGTAIVVVLLVCMFVMSFAWSWGPLGWLIPSETFPLETRAAGFSFAVSANMLFTFLIAQAFLSMMCHMKSSIFFFFAVWIFIMGIFVVFLLPETKGVPIDEMNERVWKQHWYWKKFMEDKYEDLSENQEREPPVGVHDDNLVV
ncbi:sugar transport protein 8 [Dendrobium catenatum]|uniref:Sugar transport protein 8 n=1 Tax=Dendrobium catenatum TaxID=906689 RepID=A0A2I0VPW0_9ASPA|nr:sugar transport protein 8 [Dendrobium catenatum]PKU65449.1 Sugar transport protein 8 [Dendrobium catenatum]